MKKYYESNEGYPAEEKYLYLLIYAPGYSKKFNEPIKGDTWLQKQMHVLSKFIKDLKYDFDEHNFGVFSPILETVQLQNTTSEMIKQREDNGPLQLTNKGLEVAEKIWKHTDESERKIISDLKTFLNEMDYWELIAFSYSTFPETTTNSEIKPEFNKTRLHAAISLFKKEKITLNKAATIAGIDIEEFSEELKRRHIPTYSLNKTDFEKSLKLIESFT